MLLRAVLYAAPLVITIVMLVLVVRFRPDQRKMAIGGCIAAVLGIVAGVWMALQGHTIGAALVALFAIILIINVRRVLA